MTEKDVFKTVGIFAIIAMTILVISLFITSLASAEVNEAYSRKDLHGQDFSDRDASEFNNMEIISTDFSQEMPIDYQGNPHGVRIFPANVQGVTIHGCNLNNVILPVGVTIVDAYGITTSTLKARAQNDGEDWIVDSQTGNPIEPVNKQRYLDLGLSIDPADIPAQMKEGFPITKEKERENAGAE
jgi:hypothetical protein